MYSLYSLYPIVSDNVLIVELSIQLLLLANSNKLTNLLYVAAKKEHSHSSKFTAQLRSSVTDSALRNLREAATIFDCLIFSFKPWFHVKLKLF